MTYIGQRLLFQECELLCPRKPFQFRFPRARLPEGAERFRVDEGDWPPSARIFCPGRLSRAAVMLAQSLFDVVRTADIQRVVGTTEDVDVEHGV